MGCPLLSGNAPEVIEISVLAQLGTSSKEFIFEITVNPVLLAGTLNWSSPLSCWIQNEIIEVSVLITAAETG